MSWRVLRDFRRPPEHQYHNIFQVRDSIYHLPIHRSLELLSCITVGFHHPIHPIAPVTHFMKQRHSCEKHMTTEPGKSEVIVRILFEFCHHVIVNFDMGSISCAADGRWYATLAVIQIGDDDEWISVPHQRTSSLSRIHR